MSARAAALLGLAPLLAKARRDSLGWVIRLVEQMQRDCANSLFWRPERLQ